MKNTSKQSVPPMRYFQVRQLEPVNCDSIVVTVYPGHEADVAPGGLLCIFEFVANAEGQVHMFCRNIIREYIDMMEVFPNAGTSPMAN